MKRKNVRNDGRAFKDEREITRKSRLKIGFSSDKHAWQFAKAEKSDSALIIENHPVMEDWERGYMGTLAQIAAGKGGRVLEVGFGLGISAAFISAHKIDEHVIIEANRDVFLDAILFAKAAECRTVPLFGFWEDICPLLQKGAFDGILFDTYPLSAEEVHRNHFPFFTEARRLLRRGGILTYFSDEIDSYSDEHLSELRSAGFTKIDGKVCEVDPPPDCLYWKSRTILAPIIRK